MIHREFGFVLPDAIPSGDGRLVRKLWAYGQAYHGVKLADSYLVAFDGGRFGGGPGSDVPECVWAILFPMDQYESPRFYRLWGSDLPDEHECYRPTVIRTPWADRPWLAAYTGTTYSNKNCPIGKNGKVLRQSVGLAWATAPLAPWTHNHQVIFGRNTNPNAAAGVWAVALFVLDNRVLLVVRDCSIDWPLHTVYEIASDLTYTVVGALALPSGLPWDTYLSDVTLVPGGLYALEEPAKGATTPGKAIIEWYADMPTTGPGTLALRKSGRTFASPDPAICTCDGGYMREPLGAVASPGETVFANSGDGRSFTVIGSTWAQMWTSVPSPILERSPVAVTVIE